MAMVNVSISISNKSSSLIFYLQKKAIAFKEFQHFFKRLLPNLRKNHTLKVLFQLWFKTCFCKNRIQKEKQKCLNEQTLIFLQPNIVLLAIIFPWKCTCSEFRFFFFFFFEVFSLTKLSKCSNRSGFIPSYLK